MIPEDPANVSTVYRNLITNHGEITLERVRRFEEYYTNDPSRAAQDAGMLYSCLMASLYKVGKTKIMVWEKKYKINGKGSGNLLLKVFIWEIHLDRNATMMVIRRQLSSLDTYINTIGCEITKFNAYVHNLLEGLALRRETTNDLLSNLFKGYQAASDHTFVNYINRNQEEYDDGLSLTRFQIMDLADKKYKNLKLNETCNAPSEQEEKILALSAKVAKIRKTSSKMSNPNPTPRVPRTYQKDKPEWLFKNTKPPPDKKNNACTWNERQWYWCSTKTWGQCEGKWRAHQPVE